MSSPLVFDPAALGRPFDFFPQEGPVPRRLRQIPALGRVIPASRLQARPTPAMASSGIPPLDSLTGGLPRGCLTEVCGPPSSGRTSLLLAALAAATRRQEVCALVDASDALDPQFAAAAGIDLRRMLWVRCGSVARHSIRNSSGRSSRRSDFFPDRAWEQPLEQALKTTDLLLQSCGFGLVAIDLGDVPLKNARRIPLTSWFRFRRAVESTFTVLLVVSRQSCAQTCASLVLQLEGQASGMGPAPANQQPESGKKLSTASSQRAASSQRSAEEDLPTHTQILEGFFIRADLLRSRLERKPPQSASAAFETRVVRAG